MKTENGSTKPFFIYEKFRDASRYVLYLYMKNSPADFTTYKALSGVFLGFTLTICPRPNLTSLHFLTEIVL